MNSTQTDDEWVSECMLAFYDRRLGSRDWLELASMAEKDQRMFLAHDLLIHALEVEAAEMEEETADALEHLSMNV